MAGRTMERICRHLQDLAQRPGMSTREYVYKTVMCLAADPLLAAANSSEADRACFTAECPAAAREARLCFEKHAGASWQPEQVVGKRHAERWHRQKPFGRTLVCRR